MVFLLLTLFLSGDAWASSVNRTKALAAAVVATPYPLIPAVPMAIPNALRAFNPTWA
ncbi:MAG: hypothetical protein LT082_02740 [Comamonas sp.]|nr:hypothetical protein [Comamonas sp.]